MSESNYPRLVLKSGRSRSVLSRHPWIFSGAIASVEDSLADGQIAQVLSDTHEVLGFAYFNSRCSLAARMIVFGATDPLVALRQQIQAAVALRKAMPWTQTNCMRLINAEGDGIPGLIIDRYDDTLVIQSGTLGIDQLMPLIKEILQDLLAPRCIYERSTSASRSEEGLKDRTGALVGSPPDPFEVLENGHRFIVDVVHGQKTGFFLDQREMRTLVEQYSAGREFLNCFSYSGAFSVYAARGGARRVINVDSSEAALEKAKAHAALARCGDISAHIVADAFDYLASRDWHADFVVLDPPALAKSRKDVTRASQAYRQLNRLAIQGIKTPGLLMSCSCSYHIDAPLFQTLLFQAARDCGRTVRVLSHHRQAPDHPVSLFHPEGSYLKSLLLAVDSV